MQDTTSQTLLEDSRGLSAATDPPLSHQAVAQEKLLRLFRPESVQTTATSPDNFPTANLSDVLINDAAPAFLPYVEKTLSTASAPPGTNGENSFRQNFREKKWTNHPKTVLNPKS